MPLTPGAPISDTIKELYHHGSRPRSRDQIIAIAEANHDRRPKKAFGGPMGMPSGGLNPNTFMPSPAGGPNLGGGTPQMPQAPQGWSPGMRFGDADRVGPMRGPMGGINPNTIMPSPSGVMPMNPGAGPSGSTNPSTYMLGALPSPQSASPSPLGLGGMDHTGPMGGGGPTGGARFASGGSTKSAPQQLTPAQFPSVNLNQTPEMPAGLAALAAAGSSPTLAAGAQGIPYALQMMAMNQAQQAQQLPQLQKDPNSNPPPAQGFAKGGVFGSLNARPPHSLARITEPKPVGGLLHSAVSGRTDHLPINVRHGSHVIPADVVSGFGEGNSLAGARNLDSIMRGLPNEFSRGGDTSSHGGHTPILAAGGEYIVTPEKVRAIGGGDQKKGHDTLDKFILDVRKKTAKAMLKLPPPKK